MRVARWQQGLRTRVSFSSTSGYLTILDTSLAWGGGRWRSSPGRRRRCSHGPQLVHVSGWRAPEAVTILHLPPSTVRPVAAPHVHGATGTDESTGHPVLFLLPPNTPGQTEAFGPGPNRGLAPQQFHLPLSAVISQRHVTVLHVDFNFICIILFIFNL